MLRYAYLAAILIVHIIFVVTVVRILSQDKELIIPKTKEQWYEIIEKYPTALEDPQPIGPNTFVRCTVPPMTGKDWTVQYCEVKRRSN